MVKDRAPIKTIQMAFGGTDPWKGGVARTTVQGWIKSRAANVDPTADEALARAMLEGAGRVYQRHFARVRPRAPE